MESFFLRILNMSFAASCLVLAVLLARLALKKAPKWSVCLLWALVAIRLVCPFSLPSSFSALALMGVDVASDGQVEVFRYGGGTEKPLVEFDTVKLSPTDGTVALAPHTASTYMPPIIGIWLIGAAAMLSYAAVSYLRLRSRVRTAVLLRDNIYQSENVASPFVLGIFRPRIYLPFGMEDATASHVIAHESAHLQRCDHLWKQLGFLLLAVYWFNPLCWLAYILLCRDIELACDEKVIRSMEKTDIVAYSKALLTCSLPRRTVMTCPLAFGEVGVKERIKTMLNYKKPAFWLIVVAVVACAVVAIFFLTNPKAYPQEIRANGAIYTQSGETIPVLPQGSTELGLLDSTTHRTNEHPINNFTGANLDEKYPGNMLYQSGTEADVIYLEDLSGFYIPFVRQANHVLSLNDVILLSGKGEALTWADFDGYPYTETGSGLYIRIYEINPQYSLWIGGDLTEEAPLYIRLVSEADREAYIDIRTESVTDFIAAHQLDMLDLAVNSAVLEYNSGRYAPGDFACAAHVILSSTSGQDQEGVFITAYTVVKYQVYAGDGQSFREVGGHVAPTAITFDITDDNTYSLREYWEPGDGAHYELDLREKFPESIVEDAIAGYAHLEELGQQCDAQARNHFLAEPNSDSPR